MDKRTQEKEEKQSKLEIKANGQKRPLYFLSLNNLFCFPIQEENREMGRGGLGVFLCKICLSNVNYAVIFKLRTMQGVFQRPAKAGCQHPSAFLKNTATQKREREKNAIYSYPLGNERDYKEKGRAETKMSPGCASPPPVMAERKAARRLFLIYRY